MLHAIQWSRSLVNELQIIPFNLQRCPLFVRVQSHSKRLITIILLKTSPETWYNSKYDTFFRDEPSKRERERNETFYLQFHHFFQIIKMKFTFFCNKQNKNTDSI